MVKIYEKDFVRYEDEMLYLYKCPNCDMEHIQGFFVYCPICGEKIEWETKTIS